jgi:L-aminopeptidase/D-esterase-like protein
MVSYGWKGGIGTASRRTPRPADGFIVGVLAQCNAGAPRDLRIAGFPVGLELQPPLQGHPAGTADAPAGLSDAGGPSRAGADEQSPESPSRAPAPEHLGSIVMIVATDAPLMPHQLERLARRAALGYARTGSISHHTSGDVALAFSTANPGAADPQRRALLEMLPNDALDPVFRGAVEATEEAIVNAMVAAETMTGIEGRTILALPHDRLREVLRRHGRLREP